MEETMSSSRPYLVRALYDWILDNGMTPYVLVDAEQKDVQVPTEYVEQGKIVLNISLSAVHALDLGNEAVQFNARFNGRPRQIYVPMEAIMAIYARENGKGMVFTPEAQGDGSPLPADGEGGGSEEQDPPPPPPKRAQLRVVK